MELFGQSRDQNVVVAMKPQRVCNACTGQLSHINSSIRILGSNTSDSRSSLEEGDSPPSSTPSLKEEGGSGDDDVDDTPPGRSQPGSRTSSESSLRSDHLTSPMMIPMHCNSASGSEDADIVGDLGGSRTVDRGNGKDARIDVCHAGNASGGVSTRDSGLLASGARLWNGGLLVKDSSVYSRDNCAHSDRISHSNKDGNMHGSTQSKDVVANVREANVSAGRLYGSGRRESVTSREGFSMSKDGQGTLTDSKVNGPNGSWSQGHAQEKFGVFSARVRNNSSNTLSSLLKGSWLGMNNSSHHSEV